MRSKTLIAGLLSVIVIILIALAVLLMTDDGSDPAARKTVTRPGTSVPVQPAEAQPSIAVPTERAKGSLTLRVIDESSGDLVSGSVAFWLVYDKGPFKGDSPGVGGFGSSGSSAIGEWDEREYGVYNVTVIAEGYSMKKFVMVVDSPSKQVDIALSKGVIQDTCDDKTYIKELLGGILGIDSFDIVKAECYLGRGGHSKSIINVNNAPMEVYYRSGWCSSGGSDCGWDICLTSLGKETASAYEKIKSDLCGRVSHSRRTDSTVCSYGQAFDNSTAVRAACDAGQFELVNGNKRTLSISYSSNRCDTSVSVGKFNCFDN
jgi:hypothetical protein